jgi:hypothetical protein
MRRFGERMDRAPRAATKKMAESEALRLLDEELGVPAAVVFPLS